MFCPSCGHKNANTDATCVECARPLPAALGAVIPAPSPAPAPAAPPVLLRRPGPLVPPPLDQLPKHTPTTTNPSTTTANPSTTGPGSAGIENAPSPKTAPTPAQAFAPAPARPAAPAPPAALAPPAPPAQVAAPIPAAVRPPPAPAPAPAPAPTAALQAAPASKPAPSPAAPSPTPAVTTTTTTTTASPAHTTAPARPSALEAPAAASRAAPPARAPRPTTPVAKPQSAALPGPRLALPGTFQHLLAGLVDTAGMGTAAVLGLRAALAVIGVRPSVQAVVDAFHKDAGQLLPILVVVPVVMSLWPLLAVILKATPGQRLAGLTLATTSGKPLTAGRLVLRGLCSGLFAWLFLAGPAWSLLVDRRRRGLSDMVAGTVAVKR